MPDLASPDAKQVERHHFCLQYRCAIRCANLIKFSTLSILNPMGPQPSTLSYSNNILMLVGAYYGPSDAPKHLFTSGIQHRCRLIAVAENWTYGGEKGLASAATALKLPNTARARYAMDWMDWTC